MLLRIDGLDANVVDEDGFNVLMKLFPFRNNYFKRQIFQMILRDAKGLNVNHQDCNGQTVLHRAAGRGDVEIVEELLKMDAIDITLKDSEGETALDDAKNGPFFDEEDEIDYMDDDEAEDFQMARKEACDEIVKLLEK